MQAIDSVSHFIGCSPGPHHNNTLTVEASEHRNLLDVAAAVHAFLYSGMEQGRLERVYLRYSESCDAHLDESKELAARDKRERDRNKLRASRLRTLESELHDLLKLLRRIKKSDKATYMLLLCVEETQKAVAEALEAMS